MGNEDKTRAQANPGAAKGEAGMFRELFDHASDSIFLMELTPDRGPVIIDANIAACTMHGYDRDELIGSSIGMLDTPKTARHIRKRSERLLKGEKIFFEGEHIRKDGSLLPVEVSAQMIGFGGRSYILAIDRDITERKNAERDKKDALNRLRESNQKLKGFAYLASHELQTPLMSLIKTLNLMEEKAPPELEAKCKKHLDHSKELAEKMLHTIRDMLNISTAPDEDKD
jgi:PAS domain S-box-containing protein